MKKTIGFLSAIALSSAAYADGHSHSVSVDGFLDAGLYWEKDASPATDLVINDWAFHFKAGNDKTNVMLDFGANNTFNPVLDQATINTKYDNGFNWTLGLFDRFLGYEGRDSNTWTFAQGSAISGIWTNQAHGGVLFGYDLSEMLGLHVLVANGSDSGDFDYPQFGFKLDSNMDGMGFSVGGVFESIGGELGYDMGVVLTSEFGAVALAAEVAFLKAAVADADSGLAFGLTGTGSISEGTGFGARVEWGNENSGMATGSSQLDFTVGPNFMMSEAGSIYADYTFSNESDNDATTHSVSIAYVHSF